MTDLPPTSEAEAAPAARSKAESGEVGRIRQKGREVARVLRYVLLLNLLVAIAKAAYGIYSGSLSITADSLHSLLDAAGNMVGLLALRVSHSPPDREHPYGHTKFETLAAACIGVLIALGVFEFAKSSIVGLVWGRGLPRISLAGFALIAGTWVINAGVAWHEARRGRELNSPLLLADASHTASDVFVTGTVFVALLGAYFQIGWADPAGTLVILVIVARVAWGVLKENSSVLVDKSAADSARVEEIALARPEVRACHRIRSRGNRFAVHLDMHLLLDGDLALRAAHEVAHDVEERLLREIPGLVDVTIHMEPKEDGFEGL